MKKATALDLHELAMILGMKAQGLAISQGGGAQSEELDAAEAAAEAILRLRHEQRDGDARGSAER